MYMLLPLIAVDKHVDNFAVANSCMCSEVAD